MKSKIYYTIILCVIIIVNGIVFIYQQKTISRLKQMPFDAEKRRVENILLKEGFFHSYDFEDLSIDYSTFVYNANGDTVSLRELFSGKKTIVLFMSVGSCNFCAGDNIKAIRDLRKTSDIMIGIDGLTMREFKSFVSQNNIKENVYCLPDRLFDGFNINPVVYFVVDENLKSKYFYAPSVVFPDLTKIYLEKMERMLI